MTVPGKRPATDTRVSYRQYTVLRAMLFDGASNKQIGERLFLAEDTVKTHLRRIFTALGVRDRLAVCIAVWSGAVDVYMVCADGSTRHLRDELRRMQHETVRRKEQECPRTSSRCPLATGSPPPSPSSTSMPVAT